MKLYIYVTDMEQALKGDFGFSLTISSQDNLEGSGWFLVDQTFDLDLDLNPEDMTRKAVGDLDRQIRDVQATSQATITDLKSRQQNLLALTNEKGE